MNRNNLIIIIIGVVIIGALGILFVKSRQETMKPVKETTQSMEKTKNETNEESMNDGQDQATPAGSKKLPNDVEKDLKSLEDDVNTLGTDSPNDYSDL